MADVAECPQCGRQLRVPEELLGRAVQCPACGLKFTAGERSTSDTPAIQEPIPFREEPSPTPAAAPAADPRYDDYLPRRVRRDLVPHRGPLVLIFGILALTCGCPLGLIFGIVAWTLGSNDLAEIRGGRMDPEGEGLTQAGRVCGIVGVCLGILGLCCFGGSMLLQVLADVR